MTTTENTAQLRAALGACDVHVAAAKATAFDILRVAVEAALAGDALPPVSPTPAPVSAEHGEAAAPPTPAPAISPTPAPEPEPEPEPEPVKPKRRSRARTSRKRKPVAQPVEPSEAEAAPDKAATITPDVPAVLQSGIGTVAPAESLEDVFADVDPTKTDGVA